MQYPENVPINMVKWALTEAQEQVIAAMGITKKFDENLVTEASNLYNRITKEGLPMLQLEVNMKSNSLLWN